MKRISFLFFLICALLSFSLILTSCNDNTGTGNSDQGSQGNQSGEGNQGGEGSQGGEGNQGDEPDPVPLPTCEAPSLSWNATKETLSWNAVVGAKSYVLTIDGVEYALDECSYKANSLYDGEHTATVRAIGGEGYADSAESASKRFETGWRVLH